MAGPKEEGDSVTSPIRLPVRLGIDRLPVNRRELRPLDVGDERALRTPCDDRHLDPRLAQRSQRLGQIKLAPGIGPIQDLDRTVRQRLRRG